MLARHWSAVADRRERGSDCLDCMWMRAGQRGIRLSLANLKPIPVNLVCDPWSWFDLFLKIGGTEGGARRQDAVDACQWSRPAVVTRRFSG
jgi:hypothetical protein